MPALGLTDDGDPRRPVAFVGGLRRVGQGLDEGPLELGDAASVERAHRKDFLDAEAIELERVGVGARRVGLVRRVEHGLAALAQETDGGAIGLRRAGRRVGDEDDRVGLGDRRAHVVGDAGLHRVGVLGVEAAGVDESCSACRSRSYRRSAGRA